MKIPLRSGQTLQVLVFAGDRTVACEAMVLGLTSTTCEISLPHRHNVRVPIKTAHLVVTLTTHHAAFTMDCPVIARGDDRLTLEIPADEDIQKVQRREFARVPAAGPCTIEPSDRQSLRVAGQLKDVSGGGCSLQSSQAIPKGTRVRITFELPNEGTFRLIGQVCRLLTSMTPKGAQHVIGVAFATLEDPERRRLIRFVYQAQLEMTRRRKYETSES